MEEIVTSFTQRALGLSILFLSVASGMTIARGQVYQAPEGGIAPPQMNIPPPQMSSDSSIPPLPPPNYNQITPPQAVQNYVPPTNDSSHYDPQINESSRRHSTANQSSGAYIPSEVEVFNNSTMKHGEPRAVIHTSFGDITVKLFIGQAPRSVRNFMDLARGDREFTDTKTSKKARRPFYTNLTFHKVIADDYILGGDPLGTGHGGPGYTLPDEVSQQLKFDKPGLVAMAPARDGVKLTKDSNGSQFFISLDAQPTWDGQFTIIGEVIKGLPVVTKISRTPAGPTDRPIRRVFMKTIEITEEDAGPGNHDQHQNGAPQMPGSDIMPPGTAAPPVVGPASVGPASVAAPPAGSAPPAGPATTTLPPPPPALPPPGGGI